MAMTTRPIPVQATGWRRPNRTIKAANGQRSGLLGWPDTHAAGGRTYGPATRRAPRALADKLRVLERGSDMVLAAHFTPPRRAAGALVARRWEQTVAASLAAVKAEAERRASSVAGRRRPSPGHPHPATGR
jgi:hypothetical protein